MLELTMILIRSKILQFSVNYKKGYDGYPISTPSRKYWNQEDWRRIIFNAAVGQVDANHHLIAGAP